MKIVICGAGLVGSAIASHLSEEHNDVTVVDASQENIQRLTDQVDVHGVVGVASHPDRLAEAGPVIAPVVRSARTAGRQGSRRQAPSSGRAARGRGRGRQAAASGLRPS